MTAVVTYSPDDIDPLPEVTVHLPYWLSKKNGLASAVMIGKVVTVRGRGFYFTGHASARPSDNCHRCGRYIENPVSRLVGYGPYCSDQLGINRNLDEALVEATRREVESITWEGWLPSSRVTVFKEGQDDPVVVELLPTMADASPLPAGDTPYAADIATPLASLSVKDGLIVIKTTIKYKDAIKALPGRRWHPESKTWRVPASAETATALRDMLLNEQPATDIEFDMLLAQAVKRDEAVAHKSAEELPPVPHSKTDAWHHQRQAYWFAHDLDATGLFMDMGTGKSKVVVDLVVNLQHRRTLIVCPKSVVGVWPREFERHGAMAVNVVAPRKGTVPVRAKQIADALAMEPVDVPVVAVVNYESAWRDGLHDLLLSTEWDCVVLDESHRIKSPGGKASMFCSRLGRHARRRLALTGTPMPHSPLDVYSQYRFLDPGIFGTSFARFRSQYALMGGYGGHEVLGYQRQDQLAEKMYRIGFRVMADDVLDLPPVLHDVRKCELEPAARKAYKALEDDLFAFWGEGSITAANALVRLLRLQQTTSGWLPVEDAEGEVTLTPISDAKEKLLGDLLEDIGPHEPVVVFCRFTNDLDAVRAQTEKLGRTYGELSGRDKGGLTDRAEMNPDIDVIGVQIQAGGVGIDLTRARYAVYYSTGFSLGDYEQSLARVHRPGQTRPTTYYHLQVEDTVDERVYEALQNRKDIVEFVLGLAN